MQFSLPVLYVQIKTVEMFEMTSDLMHRLRRTAVMQKRHMVTTNYYFSVNQVFPKYLQAEINCKSFTARRAVISFMFVEVA